MITEFAEIVGLLCHFRQEKAHRDDLSHRDFMEWLEYHRHEEIKNLIVNTAPLRSEVDNLLRSDHSEMLRKLDEVLQRLDEFRGLALLLSQSQAPAWGANALGLSEDAKTLLKEAAKAPDGCVRRVQSVTYGEVLMLHTQNKDLLGKWEDPRVRARWFHALDELVQAGWLERTAHYGTFRVAHTGYQLAEHLSKQTQ